LIPTAFLYFRKKVEPLKKPLYKRYPFLLGGVLSVFVVITIISILLFFKTCACTVGGVNGTDHEFGGKAPKN
jgi:hypothetical protein